MTYDQTRAALAARHVEEIGYDPFIEEPEMTNEECAEILAEYAAEVAHAAERVAARDPAYVW